MCHCGTSSQHKISSIFFFGQVNVSTKFETKSHQVQIKAHTGWWHTSRQVVEVDLSLNPCSQLFLAGPNLTRWNSTPRRDVRFQIWPKMWLEFELDESNFGSNLEFWGVNFHRVNFDPSKTIVKKAYLNVQTLTSLPGNAQTQPSTDYLIIYIFRDSHVWGGWSISCYRIGKGCCEIKFAAWRISASGCPNSSVSRSFFGFCFPPLLSQACTYKPQLVPYWVACWSDVQCVCAQDMRNT